MKCYDPRDSEQKKDDPSTWKETSNPALILAHEIDMIPKSYRGEAYWQSVVMAANACEKG